jgi:hypothetical protein
VDAGPPPLSGSQFRYQNGVSRGEPWTFPHRQPQTFQPGSQPVAGTHQLLSVRILRTRITPAPVTANRDTASPHIRLEAGDPSSG